MKRSRAVLVGILVLMMVCLILGLLGYLLYGAQRHRVMEGRPLVLIHAPLNREYIALGEGISPHATARADGGVARMELWVDGTLLAVRESPGEGPVSPLVLTSSWEPNILGPHALVVRAVSSSGVEGQASVTVEAVEAEGEEGSAPGEHIAEEGETLETIAGELGVGVEELEALNPDVPAEGLQPGDRVQIPDEIGDTPDEPGEEGAPEEAFSDEGPPPFHAAAPGSLLDLVRAIGQAGASPAQGSGSFLELVRALAEAGLTPSDREPVYLRVEALALETDSAYERVHCYVSLGGGDPRWYPDPDGDQTTDDRFDSLGGGSWDVAAHLSDAAAPLVSWPGDEPLPIAVTCEGMSGGGSDSVELGRVEISAGPEAWDGITRRAESAGGEGSFALEYRVSQEEPLPVEPQPWTDRTMTPPTHLVIFRDPVGHRLAWEYEPRDDEEIDGGFRIYLNDTLQWVEPPDSRSTPLPSQWMLPPCGEGYEFTVTAFYTEGCPDNCRESDHSEPETRFTGEVGDAACGRTVLVTFETLTTGDLGGDGDRDPADMGPVYGDFYANDEIVWFDGRCSSRRCDEEGLNHDSEYPVAYLTGGLGETWEPHLVVDLPPEDDHVQIGFIISDEDTGWGNEDDLVCSGSTSVEADLHSSGVIDTSGPSDASAYRCRVTYAVEPVGGPAVAVGERPALPLLRVERLMPHQTADTVYLEVRNVGNADWRHDLTAVVKRRSGAPICVVTWPDVSIDAGERALLMHPDLAFERPMDACVILDPGNEVRELLDRSAEEGSVERPVERYCPPLPDLTIADVEPGYSDESGHYLAIEVENTGEADLVGRNLTLHIELPDGSYLSDWWPYVYLDRGRSKWAIFPNLQYENPMSDGQSYLEMLRDGFTIVVDPEDDIVEEDEENNTHDNALVHMQVEFTEFSLVEYIWGGWIHAGDEVAFTGRWGHGPSLEEVTWVNGWIFPRSENLPVDRDDVPYVWRVEDVPEFSSDFYMPADENVYIKTRMRHYTDEITDIYVDVEYGPDENYGDSPDEHEGIYDNLNILHWEARWRITRLD